MATFKKPKEWAREINAALIDKDPDFVYNDEEAGQFAEEHLMSITEALWQEYLYLMNEQKRKRIPALKQIIDKQYSIAAAINAKANDKLGEDLMNENFFICGIYARMIEDDGETRTEFGQSQEARDFLIACESIPEVDNVLSSFKSRIHMRIAGQNLVPYRVTPLEELVGEPTALTSEIMNCCVALARYIEAGIPMENVKPMAERIEFLKFCQRHGGVTPDFIARFHKNPAFFISIDGE